MATETETSQRPDWHKSRSTGIGASEAAAALGVDPRKSPFMLWAEKQGLIDRPDLSDNEPVRWGQLLEPVVAHEYQKRSGRSVRLCDQTQVRRMEGRPHILCTPDATQVDDVRGLGNLEIKTAGVHQTHRWEMEPPLVYQIQVQHQMAVTGLDWSTLAVLFGGQRLEWYDIPRNQGFIDILVRKLDEFWVRVELGQPPEVDATLATRDALQKLHPIDNGQMIELPPEASSWDEALVRLREQIARLTEERQFLENQFRQAIGNAAFGILPSGTRYSLKTIERKAYEVPQTTYRVLRRLEP